MFAEKGGELAELTALFEGGTNDSTRLYERLILEREGEVYYRRLSEWCAAHGIALVGHPHRSDDIELERWFQVPGQDLALRWVAPERAPHQGIDGTMAHCSADAALLLGRFTALLSLGADFFGMDQEERCFAARLFAARENPACSRRAAGSRLRQRPRR